MTRRFSTRWISLREAGAFVALHHRHHKPPQGGIVALGIWESDRLVGVGILGRPVSRLLDADGAAEITRLCVLPEIASSGDHTSGAASQLLAALRRLGQALGFPRLVTYTLQTESGSSLAGAGWRREGMAGGGEWARSAREREAADFPTERKIRWSA